MTTSETQFSGYTQDELDAAVAEALENRAGSVFVGLLVWCLPALLLGLAIGRAIWAR